MKTTNQTVGVVFEVNRDDLYEACINMTGHQPVDVINALSVLLQHCLYDMHEGPQLSGNYSCYSPLSYNKPRTESLDSLR